MRPWASDYFSREGTVADWWDPLGEDDPSFRSWILDQQTELFALVNPAGRVVLDAGCGRGRNAIQAARLGGTVTAVDISSEMLELANEQAHSAGEQVDFRQADLHELPFDDATFDLVVHVEILLHLEDPQRVLTELARVLRPGGVLVLTTNGQNPFARLLQPGRAGRHAASRFMLFAATATNEAMTASFGFTWSRTPLTARLYQRFFNAPVRPLYPIAVRRMLHRAGFGAVYHRALPRLLPREHRWIALRR